MTDPTPTPQTPPQGLTDAQLLELAASEIEPFPPDYEAGRGRPLEVYGCELITFARVAIAADRAARPTPTPQTPPQRLTDEQLLELAEKELCIDDMKDAHEEHYPIEVVTDGLIAAMRAAIAAHEAARPQPTPEEVEARFRAWWGECYPNVPAGRHTVRSHVAFALHLLGGEVAA